MIRRHTRAALREGLAAGDETVALQARTTSDPLLRKLVARRVGKQLLRAMSSSGSASSGGDAAATTHTLRATDLLVMGVRNVDLTSREAVERAHSAQPQPSTPSRFPWLTGGMLLAAIGGVVALVSMSGDSSIAHSRRYDRLAVAATDEAFTVGGRPPSDPAVEVALRDTLTTFVLDINSEVAMPTPPAPASSEKMMAGRTALANSPAFAKAPPALAAAWNNVVMALAEWRALPGGEGMNLHWSDAARALSQAMADAKVGYYLDGDVRRGRDLTELYFYAYNVVDVGLVRAGDRTQRVLTLQRLDRLNVERDALGMQSKELGDPLVLLDQIEDQVATHNLPVLAQTGHFQLGDSSWEKYGENASVLLEQVDRAIRNETLAALGQNAGRAAQVAELLVERQSLMSILTSELRSRGIRLAKLEGVFLPDDFFVQLGESVGDKQLANLRRVENALVAKDAGQIARLVEDLVIASVRRHEAQHALDDENELPMPAELEVLVGPLHRGEWDRPHAMHAQAELSAYLSQIASDVLMPQYAVWSLARAAFNSSARRTPEQYVATIVLRALATELGDDAASALDDGAPSRDKLMLAARSIVAATPEVLRAAAARVWTRMFGRPYVVITDVPRNVAP